MYLGAIIMDEQIKNQREDSSHLQITTHNEH